MAITVGILQGGTNSHETSSEEANAFATDFFSEGVVGATTNTSGVAPSTGAFAANAQGTPNMTVAVTAGVAYVTGTPTSGNSQTFRVKLTANENVTIAANSTGGTRYDWVYIKLDTDKLKDPAVDASDVATLVTSRSTSASTDNGTPPTYGYAIAVVTVANGASSITNGNITDSRAVTGATPADSSVTSEKLASTVAFNAKFNQNIASSSQVTITTYTENVDYGSDFNPTTGIFTARYGGFYFFTAAAHYDDVGIDKRVIVWIYIKNSGGTTLESYRVETPGRSASFDPGVSVSIGYYLAAGYTAEVQTFQESGVTKAVNGGFSGFLVGRT